MTENPSSLVEFLAPYPPEVQQLCLSARLKILELFGPMSEVFWDATQAVCSAFLFTNDHRDALFNLAVYPKHVSLIFHTGVQLQDPEQRLRGEGKRVRNLRLTSLEVLDDPYVIGLVTQQLSFAKKPLTPVEPMQIVKVMNGPKKRPN